MHKLTKEADFLSLSNSLLHVDRIFTTGNKKERPCLTLASAQGLVLAAASLPHPFIKQHLQALGKKKKEDEAVFVGLQEWWETRVFKITWMNTFQTV